MIKYWKYLILTNFEKERFITLVHTQISRKTDIFLPREIFLPVYISGGKKRYFFGKLCVPTKLMIPANIPFVSLQSVQRPI